MQFTRLRLNGFKSFVDPTDLVISDGLTGVVGPNGCGKSNLLEALRWVMGENRPTAMRGGGMEDVIFAGAASRPARNFAEVALFIDNSERLAPTNFNENDTLEIVRRITRDAGSAFKANTKDVRARDVQMLFADASTGAHSPALVRQGQISELINAKPKARRRILEEAAGISGLYQRRHEAELKLNGAEANLARVEDVVEQLATQLRQLARQARQAARYREIGDELRLTEGALLYRRWHEASEMASSADRALTEEIRKTAEAERLARAATGHRAQAEEALPPLREEEAIAAAILQRLTVELAGLDDSEARAKATVDALVAQIDQLSRDRDREVVLNRDAGQTITALDEEKATLVADGAGHDSSLAAAADAAHEAAMVLQERETAFSQLTEDVARLAARHQSAQRLVEDETSTHEKSDRAASEARAAAEQSAVDLREAEAAYRSARDRLQKAEAEAASAEAGLVDADDARGDAQAREAEARAAHSAAAGEVSALQAEVAALAKLVARDTAEGGQVLDLIDVKSGYEKALGAALADDLRAPVVDRDGASGWAALPGYTSPQTLPTGVSALTNFVTVPDVLSRRLGQVGLVDRAVGTRLQVDLKPGQRLVSVEGDVWRWDGFRAASEDAPSASALRLQQLNRLQELKQDVEEATARSVGAEQAHAVLTRQLVELTEADRAAREARRAADAAVTEASRSVSKAEADRNIAEGKLESSRLAEARHTEEATSALERLRQAEAALGDLGDLEVARADAEDVRLTVEAARMTMMTRRSSHDELRRIGEARAKRLADIETERSSWASRLETAEARIAEFDARRTEAEAKLKAARELPGSIAAQRSGLEEKLGEAEERRKMAGDALAEAETALRDAATAERDTEREASNARESRAGAEARAAAAKEAVIVAAGRIEEELETTPEQLFEQLATPLDQMRAAAALEADVTRLRRQRDALGAVNLRAEEDAREVEEEHEALETERADLTEAIKTLRTGIANLNREGRERLLTAFEQVNTNFSMLFKHLFGGGEAKLELVESDDPLEAGLEIMCQPPGKKLSTLSLLSGGEQTLTALALIFAVFLANPAPICVLDEVDAPLDDANVTRFCDMLDEMTRRTDTRFLIITHHAVTMSRMDRLFGVTMGELGVSQLVSVDLRKAEALVA